MEAARVQRARPFGRKQRAQREGLRTQGRAGLEWFDDDNFSQTTIMTDTEYLSLAENVLKHVEAAIDDIAQNSDVDIDVSRAGKMIELGFANKSKMVLNLQPPLQEIWLAARSGGYHFKFNGTQWVATKEGAEFYALLSRCLSEHAGTPLNVTA
jgi:CyaY protein